MHFVQHFAPRSLLYVPANNSRALAKVRELRPDGIILDLEDSVAPEQKDQAREQAREALREGFGVPVLVRVNGLGTPWEHADREMVLTERVSGMVLPKVEDPDTTASLHLGVPLWLMIETPMGVLNAPQLAAIAGVAGLMMGSNDLALTLRAQPSHSRAELQYALQAVILAARAYGRCVMDAVYNDTKDPAGFETECWQGHRLGFDGKTVIHPAQIAAANQIFGVSEAEVQAAHKLIEAWQEAHQQGKSVLNYGGKMIEELHIRRARALLERFSTQQEHF